MSYTHYYQQHETVSPVQMEPVITECERILKYAKNKGIGIFGWDDTKEGYFGKPEIGIYVININGDESKSLDHETFYFRLNNLKWRFCKTARKPYDSIVCLMLLSLTVHIPGFEFSSDGTIDEWKPIIKIYRRLGFKLSREQRKEILNRLK